MTQHPYGRPPSQTPPLVGRGRNALTALGGGVLVLAVAAGAWALFGRDSKKSTANAIGANVSASAPPTPILGPVVPRPTAQPPTATPTSLGSVAPTAAKPTPSTSAARPVASKAPTISPPVTAPQRTAAIAKKDYTFKVARGDTLWQITKDALRATGRSTSNADIAAHVQKLYAYNQSVVGPDPDLIVPGQAIVWPSAL
ncbi:MAG: Peptidoglycan-binding lysin domain protein [Frankiales bacterium]|nr:Peptidoglycan-binding lysin domain protein [Frankiales bacterium]